MHLATNARSTAHGSRLLVASTVESLREAMSGRGSCQKGAFIQLCAAPDRSASLAFVPGFVRHIDTERGSLSIATPLPPKTAQRVTAIVRGALELPQEIEMGGSALERNSGKKPYTMPALSQGSSALGSSARSSRANLLRRKNG
jgi:hypothetical protein